MVRGVDVRVGLENAYRKLIIIIIIIITIIIIVIIFIIQSIFSAGLQTLELFVKGFDVDNVSLVAVVMSVV